MFSLICDFDTSTISIFLISVGTIIYSCGNSVHLIFPENKVLKPSSIIATTDDQQEITTKLLVYMLIGSSILLLTIYYIAGSIVFLMKLLIIFSTIIAQMFVLWDWIFYITRSKHTTLITTIISLINTTNWFLTENYLSSNCMAFFICVLEIALLKVRRLQYVLSICLCFLIYDVWWVFLSPSVFGKSVMVESATKLAPHLPAAITIPRKDGASLIGAGDIVLPGIILDFFIRYDCGNDSSTFNYGVLGYSAGVVVSYIMVRVMKKGQPALLWIFPSIIAFTMIAAWKQGKLKDMWENGTSKFDENEKKNEKNEDNSIGADPDDEEKEKEQNKEEEEQHEEEEETKKEE